MALTDGNYASTLGLTDVVNAGAVRTSAVNNTGLDQGALYTLLNAIVTNFNLLMTKIEADGATTTTYTPDNALTALASQGFGISDKGQYQVDLINVLKEIETNWNAILALLDADGGVTLTDYVSIGAVDLNNTVAGSYGLDQGKLVSFLDDFVTKFNLVLANMDIDNA